MVRPSSALEPLRIGLIGTGKMGVNHIRAIAACEGVRIVGVADPRADTDQLARVLPDDALVLSSSQELYDRAAPQVVHIVTPPHTHAALAREALRRGAHVYVEKPFALDAGEARSVMATAADLGMSVCAGHQCLFDHAAVQARRRLRELGTIVHVQSYFSFRTVRRGISPVDQAKDILPHAVYMLLDFMRAGRPGLAAEPVNITSVDVAADGTVYALLGLEQCRGLVVVTLTGRPVAQYVDVVGTNGCARVDLVSGAVVRLPGPGANAVAAILEPYRRAWQLATGSTTGFLRRIRERKQGYPGMQPLLSAFYAHIRDGSPAPIAPSAILETVEICETIGRGLDRVDAEHEEKARVSVARRELDLSPASRGTVLVTGAGGFLGRSVVRELRTHGFGVRGLTRQPVRFSSRVPGVDYVHCDLADDLPPAFMQGVTAVVHCAAETSGGKTDQERNSIRTARTVVEACAAAGVRRLIHVSSIAVLRPGRAILDESTVVDYDSEDRGPYVWGKAQSERVVQTLGRERGLDVRVIRLGPLVQSEPFQAPGRLGRELGPIFVAVGPRRSRIALVDVDRAAAVIRLCVDDLAAAPPVLNLVEPESPTRAELVSKLRATRPDLRVCWLPLFVLRSMSAPLVWLQRLARRTPPLDVASAFVGPRYRTDLAGTLLQRALATPAPQPAPQTAAR